MGKLISFAVPCYNSAEYMKQSIMSIVNGGEDVKLNPNEFTKTVLRMTL